MGYIIVKMRKDSLGQYTTGNHQQLFAQPKAHLLIKTKDRQAER